jgi:hypothetical protein
MGDKNSELSYRFITQNLKGSRIYEARKILPVNICRWFAILIPKAMQVAAMLDDVHKI